MHQPMDRIIMIITIGIIICTTTGQTWVMVATGIILASIMELHGMEGRITVVGLHMLALEIHQRLMLTVGLLLSWKTDLLLRKISKYNHLRSVRKRYQHFRKVCSIFASSFVWYLISYLRKKRSQQPCPQQDLDAKILYSPYSTLVRLITFILVYAPPHPHRPAPAT